MCLYLNEKFKKDTEKLKAKGKPITAYKILNPNMRAQFYDSQWKLGENISNRPSAELSTEEKAKNEVNYGFHFFMDEPKKCFHWCLNRCQYDGQYRSLRHCRSECQSLYQCPEDYNEVFKVEIQPEDLVAIGIWEHFRSIVATKCKIIEEINYEET